MQTNIIVAIKDMRYKNIWDAKLICEMQDNTWAAKKYIWDAKKIWDAERIYKMQKILHRYKNTDAYWYWLLNSIEVKRSVTLGTLSKTT